MGTRAAFFVNDPQDLQSRRWLGCIAFDGYPDGDVSKLAECKSENEFVTVIADLAKSRDDFCDPAVHGFPFPWSHDLFLTDYVYAWMSGRVMMTCFHRGWIALHDYLHQGTSVQDLYNDGADQLPSDVAAPAEYDRSAPDSIMIIGG